MGHTEGENGPSGKIIVIGEKKMHTAPDRKAILVVSFGTSYEHTRKVTIDAIEDTIRETFPDHRVYRAWTSRMIIAKLKKREGVSIPNVKEAMAQMAADGITQVTIQPTHVINGKENDLMKEEILSFRDQFRHISFGAPLLTSEQDLEEVVHIIAEEFSDLSRDSALVLMGHGTEHRVNPVYAALDYAFRALDDPHIFLGTVEAFPDFQWILDMLKTLAPKKVILAPFMIVAGDHANNDMAGESPDSWASRLQKEGYEVTPVLKGLGEYPRIRGMFVRHVKEAIDI